MVEKHSEQVAQEKQLVETRRLVAIRKEEEARLHDEEETKRRAEREAKR